MPIYETSHLKWPTKKTVLACYDQMTFQQKKLFVIKPIMTNKNSRKNIPFWPHFNVPFCKVLIVLKVQWATYHLHVAGFPYFLNGYLPHIHTDG